MEGRKVIGNAFSASMLGKEGILCWKEISLQEARELVKGGSFESIIGHEGTAQVFSSLLGVEIPPRRVFYSLGENDLLLVGQINARLPEGKVLSREELEGLPIRWLLFWLVKPIPASILSDEKGGFLRNSAGIR